MKDENYIGKYLEDFMKNSFNLNSYSADSHGENIP